MMDSFDNRPQAFGEIAIQSTAGAVPVKNEKGEISMQKVKVQRYISGKRPDYAKTYSSSESESDDEDFMVKQREQRRYARASSSSEDGGKSANKSSTSDPRLKRLLAARLRTKEEAAEEEDEGGRERVRRHRRVQEPEVLSDGEEKKGEEAESDVEDDDDEESSSSSDEDLDEEAIMRRRELMRQRAVTKAQIGVGQEEVMDKEEEKSGPEESEEEETEESETDSEEEEGARLKPVFVRAKDRLTIQEREREDAKAKLAEREASKIKDERRKQSHRMVEEEVRKTTMTEKATANDPMGLDQIITDDENDEVEYEAWKVRELRRMKRDRDERDELAKDASEIDRLRLLTEDERRQESKLNPKTVTNKASKGKYKFMQKYYHRGAFFMHEEEGVYKRDISGATLEDKFDKTVLPKVMQVKNFGRSGRTKYTHLVDQDTTDFDAAWSQESGHNVKFQASHAGGMKQVFKKPSLKKGN